MKKLTEITILHSIYTGIEYISSDTKIDKYLKKKLKKFNKKYGLEYIIFTCGWTPMFQITAIAIVHPYDTFKPKVGEDIVKGRIKRMMGKIPNRAPYNPIPEYMYINEV